MFNPVPEFPTLQWSEDLFDYLNCKLDCSVSNRMDTELKASFACRHGTRLSSSRLIVSIPLETGLSLYGEVSAAVRAPRDPSRYSFTPPIRNASSPLCVDRPNETS